MIEFVVQFEIYQPGHIGYKSKEKIFATDEDDARRRIREYL